MLSSEIYFFLYVNIHKKYSEFTEQTTLLYAEYENAARQKIMLAFFTPNPNY